MYMYLLCFKHPLSDVAAVVHLGEEGVGMRRLIEGRQMERTGSGTVAMVS